MSLPQSLQVALKEWAVVCDALRTGRQMILLRKGGIIEDTGKFVVEHRAFLLFPTYLHQNAAMLKSDARAAVEPRDAEPTEIVLRAAAIVSDIVQLSAQQQMDALDDEHVWTSDLIDMRFNYKPRNPLYLLILRGYQLPAPITIPNTPDYAGCKSWVPLDSPIATTPSTPALDDARFEQRRASILDRIGRSGKSGRTED